MPKLEQHYRFFTTITKNTRFNKTESLMKYLINKNNIA